MYVGGRNARALYRAGHLTDNTDREELMDQVAVTWSRALKIWWSFAWRSWVLSLAVMLPLQIFFMVYVFRHVPPAGTPADPAAMIKMASGMMLAWPVLMAAIVVLQAQGMKWMLRKARWSDFRVAVLPPGQ